MTDPFTPGGRAALIEQARSSAAAARWRSAGVPARFRPATLAGVATEHGAAVADPIAAWCATGVGALVLVGPPGTGKTYTALAAARVLCDRHAFMFGAMATLLAELRPDGALTARALCSPGVLILDDVGAERLTEWAAEQLDSVIGDRWLHRKPTIVTSNLAPDALRDHVGARAWSRLTGVGSLVVRLAGADLRREHT